LSGGNFKSDLLLPSTLHSLDGERSVMKVAKDKSWMGSVVVSLNLFISCLLCFIACLYPIKERATFVI
jgi:hypothetical protein